MLGKFFYKLLGKKTAEEKEREIIEFLKTALAAQKPRKMPATRPNEYAQNVARNYYADSLIVAKRDGLVLMSTEGDSFQKAVKGSSIFEYINTEFPDTRMLTIKNENKYNMICTDKDLIYIIRSTGDISPVEARKIMEELNTGLQKFSASS